VVRKPVYRLPIDVWHAALIKTRTDSARLGMVGPIA
jgi:hypothetical protein